MSLTLKTILADGINFLGKGRVSKKDFCFWIVPAGDSRSVKKVRISILALLSILLGTSAVFAVLITIACDYFRLSGVNWKNSSLLKSTVYQRNSLIGAQDDLKGKISSLLSAQSAQESLHTEIEDKLEEIENFISAAKAVTKEESPKYLASKKIPKSKEELKLERAIGGLEKKCESDGCNVFEQDILPSINSADPKELRASIEWNKKGTAQLNRLSDALRIIRAIPLLVPVQGDLTSGFGFRWSPFEGGIAKHEGIDFAAPNGTAIGVAGDGLIKEVRRDGTYGLVIDVEHSKRIISRYAHLSSAMVSPGEKVLRGDLIGQVGSTGRSTGPHLHYEVIVDGRQVDPTKYIKLADKLAELMS